MSVDLTFPKGFLWGAATSAHQVEGNTHNDWTEWERAGKVKDQSGRATNHWQSYKTDFSFLNQLNLNAYRLSVEWSRIEPKEGHFDQAALNHYREMLAELQQRGITPVVTLHHFTLPVWVARMGGWSNRQTAQFYIRFARKVVESFGQQVYFWCTLNEPTIQVGLGYSTGIWPPGKRSLLLTLRALKNLARAHNQLYAAIHLIYRQNKWPKPTVTFAHHMVFAQPASGKWLDKLAAGLYRYASNQYFLNKTSRYLDCLGVNFYFSTRIFFKLGGPRLLMEEKSQFDPSSPTTDLGWPVYAPGLYQVCKELTKLKKPIYILENGLADEQDSKRSKFIVNHLEELHRAITEGIDVRGYFHWSLLDTYEWENGYRPKYGLVAVDWATLERRPRPSAQVYAGIAGQNKITGELIAKYHE